MKFISFNINGIRAHFHQLIAIITYHNPDIIGLQETKVHDEFFPLKDINALGYHVYFYGKKKHHGVALLTKIKPKVIFYGFSKHDHELIKYRLIIIKVMTSIGIITIINSYCPQGDHRNNRIKFLVKKIFFMKLKKFVEKNFSANDFLLIMGDINIAPEDLDIGIEEKNKFLWLKNGKCSFLPEERIWLDQLLNFGFIDSWRAMHTETKNQFSWFDYRSNAFHINRGLRLDLILSSTPLMNFCFETGIDYKIRNMKKPSDHAPIWANFKIE